MKITRAWVKAHSTTANGWTRGQITCLSVSWPPVKGWLSSLIGREISDEQARRFEVIGAEERRIANNDGRRLF